MVCQETRQEVRSILGIVNEGGNSKYLGLLECCSGSKVELFSYLKDRTQGRLEGWHLHHLSQRGKEVLLKSTAGGIPVFAMSVFRFPKTLISKLSSSMANFWWGVDSHKNKIHWVSWDKLCLPKHLGGIGFRDLECFNQALLSKQAWKMINQPSSLLSRFLRSRYFADGEFLLAPLGVRPSYAWRSLLFGRDLLLKGLRLRVGNGRNVKVWTDRWVNDPLDGMRAPWIKNTSFNVNLMASDLINPHTKRWDPFNLAEVFTQGDVDLILQNQPVMGMQDFYSWKYNKNGQLTVKSAYWLASKLKTERNLPEVFMEPSLNALKEKAWSIQTSPKIRVFIWKALSEAIPAAVSINAKGIMVVQRCQTCGYEQETSNHILFECCFARQVWALSAIPNPKHGYVGESIFSNINYLLTLNNNRRDSLEISRVWSWLLWHLWKRRNGVLFEGRGFNPLELTIKAYEDCEEWLAAQAVEKEWAKVETTNQVPLTRIWKPPEADWVMCNVGMELCKSKGLAGGGWTLRNERGWCCVIVEERFQKSKVEMTRCLWLSCGL